MLIICVVVLLVFFFFKQKTAYEMRISDWSSDVCSSDLSYDLVDPTAPVPDATLYPTIKAGDRLGIGYDPRNTDLEQEILTAQLEWRFAGQKLSYVGANSNQDLRAISPQDVAGIAGDYDFNQDLKQIGRAHV